MWGSFWVETEVLNQPRPGTLLDKLDAFERGVLLSRTTRLQFKKNQLVFKQGSSHSGIYLIESGMVRTFFLSGDGKELTFAFWSPGYFVGTPTVFGTGRHSWSGGALVPCVVRHIDGRTLRELCREMPELAISLIECMEWKGLCFTYALQALTMRSADARLAQLILAISGRGPEGGAASPPLTHDQMASIVGVSRQWISVTLKRLQSKGIIGIEGKRITVARADVLREQCL